MSERVRACLRASLSLSLSLCVRVRMRACACGCVCVSECVCTDLEDFSGFSVEVVLVLSR